MMERWGGGKYTTLADPTELTRRYPAHRDCSDGCCPRPGLCSSESISLPSSVLSDCPLVILTPIPLTFVGILPGHFLFDTPFSATSMIGFIALAGIIGVF